MISLAARLASLSLRSAECLLTKLLTPNPKPQTPNPKPQTLNPKP